MVLDRPLDKEIKPVNPKGNQPWILTGRTDAEVEASKLWPPDAKSHWKDPDAGKDWRQNEKRVTEDKMVGWHHRLNGHDLEWTLGDNGGQGGLACCSPWGCEESDTTEQLNNNHLPNFPATRTSRNKCPSLWYFVKAAWTKALYKYIIILISGFSFCDSLPVLFDSLTLIRMTDGSVPSAKRFTCINLFKLHNSIMYLFRYSPDVYEM